jgi:hypothetical protein
MQKSVTSLAEELTGYWERLQKPLIKMEQKAVLSKGKLQAEVSTEISQDAAALGVPEAPKPVIEPTPVQVASDPSSIRSHLSPMAQGGFGSFTALAFNSAQMLVAW